MRDEMDMRYDPLCDPDPAEWLAMDEHTRLRLVEDHHKRARIRLPNRRLHAAMHAIVENQIALGGEVPARDTLTRLMAEGLDRHEAVHAIGTALAEHMHALMTAGATGDPNAAYDQRLRELTAEKWRSMAE